MGTAPIGHFPQELLDLPGFWGGPVGGENFSANHVLIGPNESHPGPQSSLQHGLEQIGGGGLAVGSRHRQEGHLFGRVSEPVGGHGGQGRPAVVDRQPGPLPRRGALAQHRRRAPLQSLCNIPVPVGLIPRQGHKQAAGLHGAGVVADS